MESELNNNNNNCGSSKYRRQQLNNGIEILKNSIPLSQDDRSKLSQLQALHYACIYMRKQNLISNMQLSNLYNTQCEDLCKHIVGSQFGISDTIHGFIIAVSRSGHLIYVSENVINYLGHSAIDVLLSADKFCDILHPLDENDIKKVLESDPSATQNHYEFYTSWYVSKIRRRVYTRSDTKVKISGRFISNNSLFVALCTPMLRVADRDYMDYLVAASPTCFTTIHGLDLRFQEVCEKGQTILGYTENELQGISLYEMVNFQNLKDLRKNHKLLLSNKSQRGKLETVQLLMKNGQYLNCLVNMHYGNGNHIVCRFQAFSAAEMAEYEKYSSMISSFSSSQAFTDELDGSDQMSPLSTDGTNNECDQFYARNGKHRLDDVFDEEQSLEGEYETKPAKRLRNAYSNNSNVSQLSPPQQQQQFLFNIKNEPCSSPVPQSQYVLPQAQLLTTTASTTYQTQPISPIPITDEMLEKFAADCVQNIQSQHINNTTNEFNADNLPDIDWETVNDLLSGVSSNELDSSVFSNEDSNGSINCQQQYQACLPLQQALSPQPQYHQYMQQQQQQQQQQYQELFYYNNNNNNNNNFNTNNKVFMNCGSSYLNEEELINDLLLIAEDGARCH